MFLTRLILLASLVMPATSVAAHEFWIEPKRYQVENGGTLEADFKNGQEFEGITLSFFDRSSANFVMAAGGETIPVTPRAGDAPALNAPAPARDTLVVVAHETTPSKLTYSQWEKFLKFANHKDFKTAAEDHAAAGWSVVKFKEVYTRHAKALIAVGNGEGNDRELGLKTEFVSLTNPYAANFNGEMTVAVHLDGAPRPDAQVEVFDRAADDNVTISLYRTDARGIATVPVTPGHTYLFDAVTLRPSDQASTEEGAIVWETYWAALTFAVPE